MLCVVGKLLKSIYNFMGQSAGEQVSLWGKLNRRSTWRIVFFDEILALETTDKFMLCVVGKLLKSIYNFMGQSAGEQVPFGAS